MRTAAFTSLCLLLMDAKFYAYSIVERYEATWESLDKRPLPQWYDDAKIGIFVHWGVFSVPSFGSEWFWYNWESGKKDYVDFMANNYPPNFTYQDFAKDFTAEFFDPHDWASLFQAAGAKYVVLTSKHHEGFTLWPARQAFSWNSVDLGPKRDVVGDLAQAIRNFTDLKFGLYHSLYEWFNPLYLKDKANNFRTNGFVRAKTIPELYDLVNIYKPEIIWSDGEWEASGDYWTSKNFLSWLYNDSPVKDSVVTNDRWGNETLCKHGGYYTCTDRYNPGVLQSHKWENCLTIDKYSWGFRRNADLNDYMTINQILETLAQTISCGGNFLINVGPTKEGIITPIYEERLLQLGSWLGTNGQAIYYSSPWKVQNDTESYRVWYTQKGEYVFAIVPYWPTEGLLPLGSINLHPQSKVFVLGYDKELKWQQSNNLIVIKFPPQEQIKSQWAYVLKMNFCD